MVTTSAATRVRVFQLRAQGLTPGHILHVLRQEVRQSGTKASSKATVERLVRAAERDPVAFFDGPKRSRLGNKKANRDVELLPLSAEDMKKALDHLEREGSVRGTARSMEQSGIVMSPSTLQRAATKARFTKHKHGRKNKLPRWLMKERREWADEHIDYPWSIVAFTDLKSFSRDGSHNHHNEVEWRAPDSKRPIPTRGKAKYPCAVRVFGALTSEGALDLIEVDETLDSKAAQILVLQPTITAIRRKLGTEFILETDHDPVFTSVDTQEYLQDHCDGCFWTPDETPVRSPDFWPIENVWGAMSDEIWAMKPKNKAALRVAIQKAWVKCASPERLKHMYEGMPQRMRDVVAAKGAMTKR